MDAAEQPEDLLGMDQSPTKKARIESPPAVRLEHFTCKYDPAWDYKKIAEDMFNGPRYLVMLEKLATNAHVHFQGETDYAERTFANMRQELSKTHFIRALKPTARPVKGVTRPVTEQGFQYICKELNQPLAVKGFTNTQLEDLWVTSEAYVQDKKMKVKEYVADNPELTAHDFMGDDESHSRLFYKVLLEVDQHLIGKDQKDPTRYTKRDVATGLRRHPHCTESFLLWLYKHNMF